MAQQRGMKRAAKVLKRSRKLKSKEKAANLRRLERQLEGGGAAQEEKKED